MLGSCLSDASVSRAALASSKASAALLLAPMMSASVDRLLPMSRSASRLFTRMNRAPTAISGRAAASISDSVSLVLMVRPARSLVESHVKILFIVGPFPALSLLRLTHQFGQAEQLGADLQMRLLGRLGVHLETHLVVLDHEVDDGAFLGEAGRIADDQHREIARLVEDLVHALRL